ncbi:MAG: proton-conducting transporter membrane subunit, partial [bacterium]
ITASSFVFTCLLIPPILKGRVIEIDLSALKSEWFRVSFIGDGVGLIFAMVFSLLGMVAVIYSIGYIRKHSHQSEYYFMITLLVGSLMGVAFARNLLYLFIFWEIASLTTWRLVGFYGGKKVVSIANRTFLIIFAGSSFMLLGFLMIYSDAHTFDLIALRNYSPSTMVLCFIFVGIITKAAIFPIHIWLPDAHTVAPSPVSALLSGIVVKIGILAFLRIFIWTFHVSWDWILVLAVFSSIVGASGALLETDIKKIIAYSTVSQTGYMLLGLAVLSEIGLAAGLVYFIVHAVAKAGLFLSAGIVEEKCGEREISKLGGLMKVLPMTGTAFALCSLTIIGMPPFGGFFSKVMVISALVGEGHIVIAALAIFSAILTLLYLIRLFSAVFLGDLKFGGIQEGSNIMTACVFFLGCVSLAVGLFINQILHLINVTVMSVFQ